MSACIWIIWIATAIMQPLACVIAFRKGLHRSWPSLVAFLVLRSALTFWLMSVTLIPIGEESRACLYFYSYWYGHLAVCVVEIWMAASIGCELLGISQMIRKSIYALCSLLFPGLAVATLPLTSPCTLYGALPAVYLRVDKAISVSWLIGFLFIVFTADLFGIRYRKHALGICIGFTLLSTTETLHAWLIGHLPLQCVDILTSCCYFLALLLWSITALTPEYSMDVKPEAKALQRTIATFI